MPDSGKNSRQRGSWPEYIDPDGPNPSGICQCGKCGLPAPISNRTDKNHGWIKGQPVRYRRGHAYDLGMNANRTSYTKGHEERDQGGPSPCWVWTGYVDVNGYSRDGRSYGHIRAYAKAYGPPAKGLLVHHACCVYAKKHGSDCPGGPACPHRRCVNPEHLAIETRKGHPARHRKYSPELVEQIRRATGSTRQIARQFNVSKSHVALLRRPC